MIDDPMEFDDNDAIMTKKPFSQSVWRFFLITFKETIICARDKIEEESKRKAAFTSKMWFSLW